LLEILGFDLSLIKNIVLSNRRSALIGFILIEPFDKQGFRILFDFVNNWLILKPNLVGVLPALVYSFEPSSFLSVSFFHLKSCWRLWL